MGKILNIPWFILCACADGVYAFCMACVIMAGFGVCMTIWLLIPAYLIIGTEHYIMGIIYTLFVWGIAFKLTE